MRSTLDLISPVIIGWKRADELCDMRPNRGTQRKLNQMRGFQTESLGGFPNVGGVEFPLAAEKPGSGGAVDADELAPLGGGHADVFEVGGEKLMRRQRGKGFVVRGLVGFGKLGEGFEVVGLIGGERVAGHEIDDLGDGFEFDFIMQRARQVKAAEGIVGFRQLGEAGESWLRRWGAAWHSRGCGAW